VVEDPFLSVLISTPAVLNEVFVGLRSENRASRQWLPATREWIQAFLEIPTPEDESQPIFLKVNKNIQPWYVLFIRSGDDH